MEIILLHK